MRARSIIALFAACSTAGCYYYTPLVRPDLEPGAYLSAALTDSGTDALAQYLGGDVGAVRGRLITSDDQAYTLSVAAVRFRDGDELTWRGEKVTLRRQLVAGWQERRLSHGRSVLAGGLMIAGFIAVFEAFHSGFAGGNKGGGSGPPR